MDEPVNNWNVPIATTFALGLGLMAGLGRMPWNYKLVLVVPRQCLRLPTGKLAEHCSSASILAFETSRKETPIAHYFWILSGQRKVVLRTDSIGDLKMFSEQASTMKICSGIVQKRQQPMVLAIGPGPSSVLDKITGHLKLL